MSEYAHLNIYAHTLFIYVVKCLKSQTPGATVPPAAVLKAVTSVLTMGFFFLFQCQHDGLAARRLHVQLLCQALVCFSLTTPNIVKSVMPYLK